MAGQWWAVGPALCKAARLGPSWLPCAAACRPATGSPPHLSRSCGHALYTGPMSILAGHLALMAAAISSASCVSSTHMQPCSHAKHAALVSTNQYQSTSSSGVDSFGPAACASGLGLLDSFLKRPHAWVLWPWPWHDRCRSCGEPSSAHTPPAVSMLCAPRWRWRRCSLGRLGSGRRCRRPA